MPCFFRALVYEVGGRTVAVQPETQMVLSMVDGVTSGLVAPGVHEESGKGSFAVEQVAASAVPGRDSPAATSAAIRISGEVRDIEAPRVDSRGTVGRSRVGWEPPVLHRTVPSL